jgi:hypothetical protein
MSTGWNSASREPSKVFAEDSRRCYEITRALARRESAFPNFSATTSAGGTLSRANNHPGNECGPFHCTWFPGFDAALTWRNFQTA